MDEDAREKLECGGKEGVLSLSGLGTRDNERRDDIRISKLIDIHDVAHDGIPTRISNVKAFFGVG